MKRVFRRQLYEDVLGSELHHLDFIARQFQWDAMIHEIFPHLLGFIRVNSGRLGIIDPERKVYYFYVMRRGRIHKRTASHYHSFDELHKYLKTRRSPIFFSDPDLPPEIIQFMEKFNAAEIHPFVYRKSPVGFLLLQQSPRHKHAQRALEFFSRKAAVSIHNHHLSAKLVDSHLYERELKEARKIRGFLQKTALTNIPGYRIRSLTGNNALYTSDLFHSSENHDIWIPVIICTPGINAASGIILSEVIGRLFSLNRRKEGVHLHRIIHQIRKDQIDETPEYRLDYLAGELDTTTGKFIVMSEGNFNVRAHNAGENEFAMTPGFRNVFEIQVNQTVSIEYRGEKLFEIERTEDRTGAGESV